MGKNLSIHFGQLIVLRLVNDNTKIAYNVDTTMICRLKNEHGVANLIVLAVTIPIVLLIVFGASNLVRIPMAQNDLTNSLYWVYSQLDKASGDTDVSAKYAGNRFCSNVGAKNALCGPTEEANSNLINSISASRLVKTNCELAASKLANTTSLGKKLYSYKFAVLKFDGSNLSTVGESRPDCGGDDGAQNFSTLDSNNNFDAIKTRLKERILSLPQQTDIKPGKWRVFNSLEKDFGELDSYWIYGVGIYQTEPLLKSFFGDTVTLIDYVFKPFSEVAGIEK